MKLRPAHRIVVAAAVLCTVAATAACTPGSDEQTNPNGPLKFTNGHITNMLQPLGQRAFFTLPGCVEEETPQQVRLTSIVASDTQGAESSDIEFLAAWPRTDQRLRIGAAPISMLEEPFGEYEDTSGEVQPCGRASPVTGLSIATVVPEAKEAAVVVEGLEVTYAIGEETYTDQVTVTLGLCATSPADHGDEPEGC